ncbi:MAG: hypothetical protein HS108_04265 [Planctomycetes bacterium]|jgi:hypothetical protein|nr:hypothetical protein [Planctomycetota bacterium]MCL4731327.1 hypothetical protein [Planctomycetota bacterium]
MRWWWLCLLFFTPGLAAMDADGCRFARRVLLDESARRHLGAEVGDLRQITHCTVLRADFDADGADDQAALVRNGKACVLALFGADRASPTGVRLWTSEPEPVVAVLVVAGRACVRVETARQERSAGVETAIRHWQCVVWRRGDWQPVLEFEQSRTTIGAGGRVVRRCTREIEVSGATTVLVARAADLLDDKVLEGSETCRRSSLAWDADGALQIGAPDSADVPVATRVQIARTLEREGLVAAALDQAADALAQAEREKLKPNDSRLLDAQALRLRLLGRLPAAAVQR